MSTGKAAQAGQKEAAEKVPADKTAEELAAAKARIAELEAAAKEHAAEAEKLKEANTRIGDLETETNKLMEELTGNRGAGLGLPELDPEKVATAMQDYEPGPLEATRIRNVKGAVSRAKRALDGTTTVLGREFAETFSAAAKEALDQIGECAVQYVYLRGYEETQK